MDKLTAMENTFPVPATIRKIATRLNDKWTYRLMWKLCPYFRFINGPLGLAAMSSSEYEGALAKKYTLPVWNKMSFVHKIVDMLSKGRYVNPFRKF